MSTNPPISSVGMPDIPELTPGTGEAVPLVTEKFEAAQAYGEEAFNLTMSLLQDLELGGYHLIDVSSPWTPQEPTDIEYPPQLTTLDASTPTDPELGTYEFPNTDFSGELPDLADITIDSRDVPLFNNPLPEFILPDPPDATLPDFTATPPPQIVSNIPAFEEPELPLPPQLDDIVIPDPPDFVMPVFEGVKAVKDFEAPDVTFTFNEEEYSSELLTALQNRLLQDINAPAPSFSSEVEQAIYDRATARLELDLENEVSRIAEEVSAGGARLQQGITYARIDQARHRHAQRLTDLSNDIIRQNAELSLDWQKTIIASSLDLERTLIGQANDIQNRALDAAKFAITSAIDLFEAKVAEYTASLEAYKVEADVYLAKIQAQAAQADVYRTIIESKKITADIQRTLVDLYQAELLGVQTRVNIYNAKLDGVKLRSEIYQADIDAFRALIESYEAQVGLVTARYALYQSQIDGEKAKIDLYNAQVANYQAVIEGYKTVSEIDTNRANIELQQNDEKIRLFQAQLEEYRAVSSVTVDKANIQAQSEGLQVQLFDSKIRKFESIVSALTQTYRAMVDTEIANIDADLRYGEILSRIELARSELEATLAEAQARLAGTVTSASFMSVNASAALGYQEGKNDSTSTNANYGQNANYSTSTAWSESHIYQGE